jgi:hypothetical protein
VKVELRAMTKKPGIFDKLVIRSSTSPSAKYSCSGSPLMLVKGRTAIDGLAGTTSGSADAGVRRVAGAPSQPTSKTRIGRAIFLSVCSPMSS